MVMFFVKSVDSESLMEGSSEIFHALTGAEWTETMVFPEGEELQDLRPANSAEYELLRFLVPSYQCFKKKPVQLYLKQGIGKGFHSVYAAEAIPKGTVVTEYLGEWRPSSTKHSWYRWGPIDGLHVRNLGGMVEDGFPNVAAFHLYHIDGVPKRVVFIALEDIPKDTMIAVDYGMNHSVKVQYHTEYRADEMNAFFLHHPFHKIFSRIKELQGRSIRDLGWRRTIELENLASKVRYLFHTPSALMLLMLKKSISCEEVRRYYLDPEYRYFILGFPLKQNYRHKEVSDYIERVLSYAEKECIFPEKVHELSTKLRQRIFYRIYLDRLLLGGDPLQQEAEAYIWNAAFDAVQGSDREHVALSLEQTSRREDLIKECLFYAKEVQSTLVPWLQNLSEPPLPLSPTG